jgi:DNA repair exonuclease SbcCD ATPase subunit
MVPIRLQLRNFLSYGDNPPQEIDLQGVHMAALVGNNGAGKSALLDAITWALFGEARSNRNEQLLRQGANEMSVTFEFEVEGQIYRVRRRFLKEKTNPTLQLWSKQVDGKKVALYRDREQSEISWRRNPKATQNGLRHLRQHRLHASGTVR